MLICFFLNMVTQSCHAAIATADRLLAVQRDYRTRLQKAGRSANLLTIVDLLFRSPILSIPQIAERLDVTYRSAQLNVGTLVSANVLQEIAGAAIPNISQPVKSSTLYLVQRTMPDLLLELFSEEIPARMQRQAAQDLKRLVTNALVEAGLTYEGAQAFATPRRLTLHVVGLPVATENRFEHRKGPRIGAPEAAIQGFLKSTGFTNLDKAQKVADGKKGEFWVVVVEHKGCPTPELIADLLPPILRAFPWPKSMRWGAGSTKPDALRWVRPLRSILCLFGGPHETPQIVPFTLDGLASGDTTHGHRFMAPDPIRARRFEDYVEALQKAKVVLDADRRKDIILADARSLALAHGLELVEDEGLLEEVAGLVEWPVVLMGEFEPEFLEIPPEVIRATIRANQKCFVLRDAQGKLANRFLLVSNLIARDGGAAIAAGNARVVRARLTDARHFWATDLAPLPDYRDRRTSLSIKGSPS